MKIRNLIISLSVFIINVILGIVFYKKNAETEKISFSSCVFIIILSYIVYAFVNLHLFVLRTLKQDVNSEVFTFLGTFVCTLAFIVIMVNIRHDPFLYLPLLFITSILGTLINYIIYRITKR
ncbi:membrane protein YdbS with pleckstrin-like domain [Treponema rectale]|uniref:Membrane protein YdbS with pleckstrin-like domain n=1 Tax=Treponema rectale TaxID=744512 RepID=A0A840SEX2_9SPIR|nr:membrane protein YdbS with pleckstrin-like domain [Treponema rectale]